MPFFAHHRSESPSSAHPLRLVSLGALLVLCASGCERPDIVGPERQNFTAKPPTGLSLDLVDASLWINGRLRSDRINLSTDRFVYLFVFVKSSGLYIVSAEQLRGTEAAGRFEGSHLTLLVQGTRIELVRAAGDVLGSGPDRTAWVEFLPGYSLLGPDARPDDVVIGLAARKDLIPGFLEQNDPPSRDER